MRYLIVICALLFSNVLFSAEKQDLESYFEAIEGEIIYGPSTVDVDGVVTFEIVYGQAYLNKKHITEMYRIMDQPTEEHVVGWIIPDTPSDERRVDSKFSLIKVEVADIGHVSAGANIDWDYDRLIKNITEDQKKRGNAVLGWVETPNYEISKRNLKWSFEAKREDKKHFDVYQSVVLGRSGMMGFAVIAPSEHRRDMLTMSHTLLDSAQFTPGNRYEDYEAGVDRESAAGLAALVGGAAAAKKLGVFAIVLGFLVKFWKVIVLVIGGIALILGLKKKKSEASE